MEKSADWPEKLRRLVLPRLPEPEKAGDISTLRRTAGLVALRNELVLTLCQGAVSGTRWDTLVGNLVFPFLAIKTGEGRNPAAVERFWDAWYPGDVPDSVRRAVRELDQRGPRSPISNGMVQGLLGLQLAHNSRPVATQAGSVSAADAGP
jgi:hypothetical protein